MIWMMADTNVLKRYGENGTFLEERCSATGEMRRLKIQIWFFLFSFLVGQWRLFFYLFCTFFFLFFSVFLLGRF